jgi:hypothetical protein
MHRAEALPQDLPATKFAVSRRRCSARPRRQLHRRGRCHQLALVHAPTQTARVPRTAFIAAMLEAGASPC